MTCNDKCSIRLTTGKGECSKCQIQVDGSIGRCNYCLYAECLNCMGVILVPDEESTSTTGASMKCQICFVNPKEVAFIECGHYASCHWCVVKSTQCPICKVDIIEKPLRIYNV